jgi:hypothetical protein
MDKCFVIQPFDGADFDNRYEDTFKPAISKAGLEPYRTDKDPSVRIPIEDIEKGIASSAICFADITLDNPNVWYELGYAFACGKDVIMVCSEEREGRFPFDIQHRTVTKYKTGSKSDFETLEKNITQRIIALQQTNKKVEKLQDVPVQEREGLKGHEIALLILAMGNQPTPSSATAAHYLKPEMNRAGYNDLAASLAIRSLARKDMLVIKESGYDNEVFDVCQVTKKGEDWIIENEGQLEFRKESNNSNSQGASMTNDLPF